MSIGVAGLDALGMHDPQDSLHVVGILLGISINTTLKVGEHGSSAGSNAVSGSNLYSLSCIVW